MNNKFDIHEPSEFHLERFEKKLKEQADLSVPKKKSYQKYYLAIAASLLLLVGIGIGKIISPVTTVGKLQGKDLASVSPKMEKTQLYYTNVLNEELDKIRQLENPENKKVIDDFLKQIEKLETEYTKLTIELEKSGNQKVIFAMISNYQKRIEILQNLILTLEKINSHKTINNENFS
ncbi:hypothetical protein [Aureivirga sp. CE67]|uniref:hypothetical protein n=1 Tax=Aureivirga sp. CE67 TaxID=1788983 RepID=UPI0018CB9323|nr:hypothetical protein [Aureivirga sp. CE67]